MFSGSLCFGEDIFETHKVSVKPHLFFENIAQPGFIKKRLLKKETALIHLFAEILDARMV
jgi:hypothetical protein